MLAARRPQGQRDGCIWGRRQNLKTGRTCRTTKKASAQLLVQKVRKGCLESGRKMSIWRKKGARDSPERNKWTEKSCCTPLWSWRSIGRPNKERKEILRISSDLDLSQPEPLWLEYPETWPRVQIDGVMEP